MLRTNGRCSSKMSRFIRGTRASYDAKPSDLVIIDCICANLFDKFPAYLPVTRDTQDICNNHFPLSQTFLADILDSAALLTQSLDEKGRLMGRCTAGPRMIPLEIRIQIQKTRA